MNSSTHTTPVGRFAPSPTGRMHMGNLFTALISWLSVKSRGGKWILRIEDLDPQRSRREYAEQIEADLLALGLEWDEGGLQGLGPNGPYVQSERHGIYDQMLERLKNSELLYPCTCRRADLHAAGAPHASDGRVIYSGRCRPASLPAPWVEPDAPCAVRIAVPDRDIVVADRLMGTHIYNMARECGDFVLRRADGAWAYQLAVTADDALMGVTEVVRGADLLSSAAQQIFLFEQLGFTPPEYMHVPLVCNARGVRLSKRDTSMQAGELFNKYGPEGVLGILGHMAGLHPAPTPTTLTELLQSYSEKQLCKNDSIKIQTSFTTTLL